MLGNSYLIFIVTYGVNWENSQQEEKNVNKNNQSRPVLGSKVARGGRSNRDCSIRIPPCVAAPALWLLTEYTCSESIRSI